LLGYAGGGRLGNFGDVGVDQATFGPAVFVWFVGIGGLTVVMSGGLRRRPKARPVPSAAPPPTPEPEAEPDTLPVPTAEEAELEPEVVLEPDQEPEPEVEIELEPEAEVEPVPPPEPAQPVESRPVRAAPRDVFDFDDDPEAHYFADDDHTSDEPRRSSD